MTLTGARLSSLARCPRQCAYTALGVEAAPFDETTRRYFARGHMYERYVVAQLQAKYGKENVEHQRVIPWEHGLGHADAFVKPLKLLVEVFSTVSPRGLGVEDKIRQLCLYLFHDKEAEQGLLYIVNPSDLKREDAFPVKVTKETEAWIRDALLQVKRAVDTKGAELPACSKANPTECRYNCCAFTDLAWADWQEPEPAELQASPELAELLVELDAAKSRESAARSLNNQEHRRCQEIQNELANLGVPAGKSKVGPFEIRRTPVKGRETFSVAMARKAGAWSSLEDEMLGAFMKVGEPHERWELKRVSDEVLVGVDDYGDEVPF